MSLTPRLSSLGSVTVSASVPTRCGVDFSCQGLCALERACGFYGDHSVIRATMQKTGTDGQRLLLPSPW